MTESLADTPPSPGSAPCPVCDGHPRVALAIRHSLMRRFTQELLERDHACWAIIELDQPQRQRGTLTTRHPDLLVVDGGPFPDCCPDEIMHFPPSRVVVIGTDPDTFYAMTALSHGAGAWIAGDHVGDQLGPAMRRILGCTHDPCPSS